MLRLARVKMLSLSGSRRLMGVYAKVTPADLAVLRDLVAAAGVTSVIDRRYRLSEVPDAMRYLAKGHARGKVVITFEH
jgi:D-arabinose 1-dehydrogenase-like Zn-dependent alcohol dehydrogenase